MPVEMKPLSEMSEEEMMVWIEKLRSNREALRAEGIAKKKEREAPRERQPRQPKPQDAAVQAIVNDPDLWT